MLFRLSLAHCSVSRICGRSLTLSVLMVDSCMLCWVIPLSESESVSFCVIKVYYMTVNISKSNRFGNHARRISVFEIILGRNFSKLSISML